MWWWRFKTIDKARKIKNNIESACIYIECLIWVGKYKAQETT